MARSRKIKQTAARAAAKTLRSSSKSSGRYVSATPDKSHPKTTIGERRERTQRALGRTEEAIRRLRKINV
jgi:hypothetical protein